MSQASIMYKALLLLVAVSPLVCYGKSNAVLLSLGYPAITGLYYEREINSFALGVNPGLFIALIRTQPRSYNPSVYGGYIFNKSDKIQISINLNTMYYYAYGSLISWANTKNNLREDILFIGPDISARWHLFNLFFQASTGFRLSYEMWYGSGASDSIKYSFTYYSFSLSIGYSF